MKPVRRSALKFMLSLAAVWLVLWLMLPGSINAVRLQLGFGGAAIITVAGLLAAALGFEAKAGWPWMIFQGVIMIIVTDWSFEKLHTERAGAALFGIAAAWLSTKLLSSVLIFGARLIDKWQRLRHQPSDQQIDLPRPRVKAGDPLERARRARIGQYGGDTIQVLPKLPSPN
jgi:hypothetical protein